MADEENNENVEETTPAPAAEATDASVPADASAGTPKGEPVPQLGPKERRQQARAARAARTGSGARQSRTPEERQAERELARGRRAAQRRSRRAKEHAASASIRGAPTPPREHGEGRQKERQGVVVSDKADKTIVVRIDMARRHRRYEKIVRSSTTLHAHDERNDAHTGDTVVVRESRPLSRMKRWRLVEVVERAK
jgi:small subunit ribosomal protein S17